MIIAIIALSHMILDVSSCVWTNGPTSGSERTHSSVVLYVGEIADTFEFGTELLICGHEGYIDLFRKGNISGIVDREASCEGDFDGSLLCLIPIRNQIDLAVDEAYDHLFDIIRSKIWIVS